MSDKFRILSLSGGGIRGLYTASFLAKAEALIGKSFADHFDLIVGTSTGGLLALALGLGRPMAAIRDFYKESGPVIFPPAASRGWAWWKQIVYPKHDEATLRRLIQEQLGEDSLVGHSTRPLIINTFHAAGGKPVCFKTRHHPDFVNDHRMKAWHVAMATSAAPVYYRAFQADDGTDYIDGGVWANCPVLVGAIEAIHRFGKSREEIEILSVGTTRSPFRVDHEARTGGAWRNVSMLNPAVVNLLMEANRAAAMNMTEQLIGRDSILEIDRLVDGGGYNLDDTRPAVLRDLQSLGEDAAKTSFNEVRRRFFQVPADPWTPVP